MYSFGPLPKVGKSGRIIGAHQKIDRVARRHLDPLLVRSLRFPDIATILKFEGINGPDGMKLKSPGVDEPWHFIDPKNLDDSTLLVDIRNHSSNLSAALYKKDMVRAAFEAAWLAHAVVDGLTPAHHEPEEETLVSVRDRVVEQKNMRSRVVVSGDGSAKQFVKNNWDHWGAGGTMTTHTLFEAGVATTIKTLKFEDACPSANDLIRLKQQGFETLFLEALQQVAALDMYTQFKKRGWTRTMASVTRRQLVPLIIDTVILAWHAAYADALARKARAK